MNIRLFSARHRRPQVMVVSLACFVILGGAGTAVAVSSSGARNADPGQQNVPASSGVDPAVAAQLSVFRHAPSSGDALPAGFRAVLQQGYGYAGPNIADARHVKASSGQTAYLVPANGGMCVVNTNEALCAPDASLPGADSVDLCSPTLPKGEIEMEWLVPDGATNVSVRMTDHSSSSFANGFNVYIARFPTRKVPNAIEWDSGGQHHSVGAGLPSDASSESCLHPSDLPPASQLRTVPSGVEGP